MEREKGTDRVSHKILLGIAGLVLTAIIAVGAAAWAIRSGIADNGAAIAANTAAIAANAEAIKANTKAIEELRGLMFSHISSHSHASAGVAPSPERAEEE